MHTHMHTHTHSMLRSVAALHPSEGSALLQPRRHKPNLPLPKGSSFNKAPRRRPLTSTAGGLGVRNAVAPTEASAASTTEEETSRRSGNYHPSIWSHSVVTELMRSSFSDAHSLVRMEELKVEARLLLRRCETDPLGLLRTIDSIERLGIAYHFKEEIDRALAGYHESSTHSSAESCEELALGFRLLRQHGFRVGSEHLLQGFKGLTLDPKNLSSEDVRCLVELYEASHLAVRGEPSVGDIKHVVSAQLGSLLATGLRLTDEMGDLRAQQVRDCLQMPVHWTMPRLEAQWYIGVYEGKEDRNPILLELAKLDFNIVQAFHQRELRELSRWWKGLGLIENLAFARDRLVENYLWAMGIAFEPQFYGVRIWLTKLVCILTVIDDVYDVYGSFDELKLFTRAVERWEVAGEAVEMLPDYMKQCFLALYDLVNETASEISRIQGWDAMPFVRKEWQRLCKGYMLEATWFECGHKPSMTEYLENAWITVGGAIAMAHVYLLQTSRPIPHELADCLSTNLGSKLIGLSSTITRINDDLGTSEAEMLRGDVPKMIECVMEDTGESREWSRERVKCLMGELWAELNDEWLNVGEQLPEDFLRMVVNMSRASHSIFQHGDGIGTSTSVTKDRIHSLFVQSI